MADTPALRFDQIQDAIVTAPGTMVEVLAAEPSTTVTTTSATFADVDTNLSTTFSVPSQGSYIFTMKGQLDAAALGAEARWRLVFDAGTGSEQLTEDTYARESSAHPGGRNDFMLNMGMIKLTAGSHTVKVQWRRITGSGTLETDPSSAWGIHAQFLGGSGVGGTIIEQTKTAGSEIAVALNTTYTMISDSITVSGPNDVVLVAFNGWCKKENSDTNSYSSTRLHVDGSVDLPAHAVYYKPNHSGNTARSNNSFVRHVTGLTAGSHLFEIIFITSTHGAWRTAPQQLDLTVIRGGQIPWAFDSTVLTDTPVSVDVKGPNLLLTNSGGKLELSTTQAAGVPGVGMVDNWYEQAPDATYTMTSSWADVPGITEDTFTTAHAGWYKLDCVFGMLSEGTTSQYYKGRFRLLIDESNYNGFTEQTIGGDTSHWEIIVYRYTASSNEYSYKSVHDKVYLEAGTHKLVWQCYSLDVTHLPRVSVDTSFQVQGTLVMGTGAGGVVTYRSEESNVVLITGSFSASWSPTFVSNCNVTFTAVEGEYVTVRMGQHDMQPHIAPTGGNTSMYIGFCLDGTTQGDSIKSVNDSAQGQWENANVSLDYLVGPLTAGSHTIYPYAGRYDAANVDWNLRWPWCEVVQYRGGLIPWKQDGSPITATPDAIDVQGPGLLATDNDGTLELSSTFLGGNYPGTGMALTIYEDTPSVTSDLSSTSYADVPSISEQTFEIPFTGTYKLDVYLTMIPSTTSGTLAQATFRAMFDAGNYNGFTEQTIGEGTGGPWHLTAARSTASAFAFATVPDSVFLEAGSHKVKLQYIKVGSETARVSTLAGYRIQATLLAGSGAGGTVLNQSNAGTASVTYTADAAWTDMLDAPAGSAIEVSFEVGNAGEDVYLTYSTSTTSQATANGWADMRLLLDGTTEIAWGRNRYPVAWCDTSITLQGVAKNLSVGTHTVKAQIYVDNAVGGFTVASHYGNPRSVILATQFRGGIVPWQQDSSTLTTKPNIIDVQGPGLLATESNGTISLSSTFLGGSYPGDGMTAEWYDFTAASDQNLSSTSWADIPTFTEQEFTVPFTGTYKIDIVFSMVSPTSGTGRTQFRTVWDSSNFNGFTEQTIGGDEARWRLTAIIEGGANMYPSKTVPADVFLQAGTHRVKFQYKTTIGTPRVSVNEPFIVRGTLLAGSGAGGQVVSETVTVGDSGTITSATAVSFPTPITLTFDSATEELALGYHTVAANRTASANTCFVQMYLDGNPIGRGAQAVIDANNWSDTLNERVFVSVTQGSHTVELKGATINTIAWEVTGGTRLFVEKYRGGIVPWEQDSSLITNTPGGVNVKGPGLSAQEVGGLIELSSNYLGGSYPGTGANITFYESAPSTVGDLSSATWADVPNISEQTFQVPFSGTYKLDVLLPLASGITDNTYECVYRALFDESDYNGFTEQIIGSENINEPWGMVVGRHSLTQFTTKTVPDEVFLQAGQHKVKFQYKQILNTARVSQDMAFKIQGTMISGSGAGGALVQRTTNTSNLDITADHVGGTWDELTDFDQTFDANTGDVIGIDWNGYASFATAGVSTYYVEVWLDGYDTGTMVIKVTDKGTVQYNASNLSASTTYGPLTAGTHTLKVRARKYSTGEQNWILYQSWLASTIYRGGLVPYEQDGVDVGNNPTAINVKGPGLLLESQPDGSYELSTTQYGGGYPGVGLTKQIYDQIPDATYSIGTTAWTDVPGITEEQFEVPVTGLYHLNLEYGIVAPTTSGQLGQANFRVVFDAGDFNGFTEQTIGNETDARWRNTCYNISGQNTYDEKHRPASVHLEAGAHKVKFQYYGISNSPRVSAGQHFSIWLSLISGSGMGGEVVQTTLVNQFVVNQDREFSNWNEVTALEQTVTTNAGESVSIYLDGQGTCQLTGGATHAYQRVWLDGIGTGTNLSDRAGTIHDQWYTVALGQALTTGPLTAGDHTIKIEVAKWNAAAPNWEYSTTLTTVINRGGQLPWKQDSVQVLDNPGFIDVQGPGLSAVANNGNIELSINEGGSNIDCLRLEHGSNFLITDSYITGSTPYTMFDQDVTCFENEQLMISFIGQIRQHEAGITQPAIELQIDNVNEVVKNNQETVQWHFVHMDFTYVTEPLTAGTHNVKLLVSKYQTANSDPTLYVPKLHITRIRGGYVQAENYPIFSRNDADTSVILANAAPGAQNKLWVTLSDGRKYWANAPLSVDIDATGIGGRDALDTIVTGVWNIYAVATGTGREFGLLLSSQDPVTVGGTGPTDSASYGINRYMWSVHCWQASPAAFAEFVQCGDWYYMTHHQSSVNRIAYVGNGSPPTGSWQTTTVANMVPVKMADIVQIQTGLDLDTGGDYNLAVAGGNPPPFTPSAGGAQESSFITAQSAPSSHRIAAEKHVALVDDMISYYWITYPGLLDWALKVRGYRNKMYLPPPGAPEPQIASSISGGLNADGTVWKWNGTDLSEWNNGSPYTGSQVGSYNITQTTKYGLEWIDMQVTVAAGGSSYNQVVAMPIVDSVLNQIPDNHIFVADFVIDVIDGGSASAMIGVRVADANSGYWAKWYDAGSNGNAMQRLNVGSWTTLFLNSTILAATVGQGHTLMASCNEQLIGFSGSGNLKGQRSDTTYAKGTGRPALGMWGMGSGSGLTIRSLFRNIRIYPIDSEVY